MSALRQPGTAFLGTMHYPWWLGVSHRQWPFRPPYLLPPSAFAGLAREPSGPPTQRGPPSRVALWRAAFAGLPAVAGRRAAERFAVERGLKMAYGGFTYLPKNQTLCEDGNTHIALSFVGQAPGGSGSARATPGSDSNWKIQEQEKNVQERGMYLCLRQ